MKKSVLFINGIILIVLVYFLSSVLVNNEIVLPSINNIFKALGSLFLNNETYKHFLTTFSRTIISFLISFIIAFSLSLIGLMSQSIRYLISPLISLLKSVPTISVILILIIIAGFKNSPYIVVILLTLPILYEGINLGFDSFDKNLHDVLKIYSQDNYFYNLFNIRIPLALPSIVSSIISTFGLAFKSCVMAEVLIGSTALTGIGYQLTYARNNLSMDILFAWTIIITFIIVLIDYLLYQVKQLVINNIV